MEGSCTLVKPAGGTGERVAIGSRTLPFSLHQLDALAPEDINSRKDFHKDQRIIRWIAMTRISFAPARFSWLMSIYTRSSFTTAWTATRSSFEATSITVGPERPGSTRFTVSRECPFHVHHQVALAPCTDHALESKMDLVDLLFLGPERFVVCNQAG